MQGTGSFLLMGFLIAAAAVGIFMVVIARTTQEPTASQADVQIAGYRLRRGWLWALAAAAVVALGISIPAFPYAKATAVEGRHYNVLAMQYGFTLPSTIPKDTAVVFDVTSKDVNHGFGIYDPNGHIVAQVQAMPGYVNHLAVTFSVPGHYVVRCLEYCGIAHAAMQGAFDVR